MTFEYLCGDASSSNSHFLLLGIYRPGSQPLSAVFFNELSSVFEQLMTLRCPVVICGDFNIHVDQLDDVYAVHFVQLLKLFNCIQHVSESTHVAGHILDLVSSRKDTSILNCSSATCYLNTHLYSLHYLWNSKDLSSSM